MKKHLLVLYIVFIAASSLMAQDVVNNEVEKAVKGLASVLLRQLDVEINEITLAGTDKTSGFSVYLHPIIKHHAVRNSNSMFNVVEITRSPRKPGEPSKGSISGTYITRGNTVEVYLELNVDGRIRSSHRFTIPVSSLEGISLLPANSKTQEEAKKQDETVTVITGIASQAAQEAAVKQEPISPPRTIPNTPAANITSQVINIQAWFDSKLGNRVYMHREPLDLTIMADKDCYFKVYIINANNDPPQMYYPNKDDTDNRLFANKARTIFEKAKYYLYKPYGTETIWIVASLNKFEGIEKEYVTPWTAETIRTALHGNSRGDLESPGNSQSFSGVGNVRYTINVLPPDQEYKYSRPENMAEFVETMRSDTRKQNGTFDDRSNQTSGFSILENVRISYRIPRDAPDTIEFAYYNLNILPGSRNVVGQMRGPGFSFEINKPGNITQTIQFVRTSIESKGGVFQGNEQQGSFKANGIAGQYRISEKVNVTITEKPALVPNLLIEREVRNYFGGDK